MNNRGIGIKTVIIVVIILIVAGVGAYIVAGGGSSKTLKVSGSTTVRPLAKTWRDQYMKENPEVRISISGGGSGSGIADVKEERSEIGMSSSESLVDKEPDLVKHVMAYDGIMVIANKNFPGLDNLMNQGIKKSTLQNIYNGNINNWNQVPGININHQLNNYRRSEESGTAETFASFLGMTQAELAGEGQTGNSGIKQAVQQDQHALGFVGAAYAFEGNIEEVPIDGNNDGQLQDYEIIEDYEDLKSDIDDYPIKRGLYFATKGEPTGLTKEFIDWCKEEGQQYVADVGYIPISSN